MTSDNTKVFLIGLGGCSSSGKSTIAKITQALIPNSILLHQDDFFKHDDQIPINKKYNIQDWDSPEALDLALFRDELRIIKETGDISQKLIHNDNVDDPFEKFKLSQDFVESLKLKYLELIENNKRDGVDFRVVLVDGFMLYSDLACSKLFDLSLLIRSPYLTLKHRRAARPGYQTLDSFWVDPPYYFDEFVYRSYVDTHKYLFVNEDVEGHLKSEYENKIYDFDNNDSVSIDSALLWVCDRIVNCCI